MELEDQIVWPKGDVEGTYSCPECETVVTVIHSEGLQ
jgi:hypothetical protein